MYRSKWATFNLPLKALEAAKTGVELPSPNSHLGTEGQDIVSFQVPTFQRGLVWTPKHGRDFQRSLELGWPIGEIVLAERESTALPNGSGQRREFDLIDGQQRTYWLNRTRDRFYLDALYSLEGNATSPALTDLATVFRLNGPTEVTEVYRKWTSRPDFTPSRDLEDLNRFLHFLTGELGIHPPTHGTESERLAQDAIVQLNSEVKNQHATLLEMAIPVLVIRHALSDSLHEIFQHLNSGTKLSDLDLLAADWSMVKATIADSKTLDSLERTKIFDFARERISETYDSDDYTYDPDLSELQPSEMSLFDILYGLGKYAADRYPDTFASLHDTSDRLALFVAALLFTGSINGRKSLARLYPDEVNAPIKDVSAFPSYFLRACKDLDSAFNGLNAVRAGKRLKGRIGLIQAATYISSYIANVYWVGTASSGRMEVRSRDGASELAGTDGQRWSVAKRSDAFKRGLIGWFLHDVLTEEFQGSDAYAAASSRVWRVFDRDASPPTFEPNNVMLSFTSGRDLVDLLQQRFEKEALITQTPKQRRYSEAACAILRVAYSEVPAAISDEELDHVIPFEMRKRVPYPIAINHPGNMMPIKKRINGARRERFLDQFLQDPALSGSDAVEIQERLLVDATDCDSKALANESAYTSFLKKRYAALAAHALRATRVPEFSTLTEASRATDGWLGD